MQSKVKNAPMHPQVMSYVGQPVVAIDTETTGLDWWSTTFRIGGYVLYTPDVGACYIPVGHETMFDKNEDRKWVAESVGRLARDKNVTWLMHNRVYDENVLKNENVVFAGEIVDTIGLWWTINSFAKSFALKKLGVMVDPKAAEQEMNLERFIRDNKLARYTQVPVDVMRPYAEQDGRLTYLLWELGMKTLPKHQEHIHIKEQKWIALMSKVARVGLPVDVDLCQQIIDSHLSEAHKIRVMLAKATGIRGFNPGSPPQVQRMAGKLGVNLPSTEMASLWASNLPKELRDGTVRYRQLIHTVGSYLEPFISISRNARDKRVHTTFRTTTDTGRLAAGDPINLQGLPRTGAGDVHRVREVVRYPDPDADGRAYLDYAQIDVRIGAHYAQDAPMMRVLSDPEGDVHTMVMNEIQSMGIAIDRSDSKRLVFGSQYMIGAVKFAGNASGLNEDGEYRVVSERQAATWLQAHRRKFPGFPRINRQVEDTMRSRGYIILWDGKLVVCPEGEDPFKSFAWLVQGGGAQLIKTAMIEADEELRARGFRSVVAMQVHDEVHVEGPMEELEEAAQITAKHMAYAWPNCRVPLYVQPEIGAPSWGKKKPLGQRVPVSEKEWLDWRNREFAVVPANVLPFR